MRHLRNKTILLADHNAADVAEMKRILGQFGLSECLHVVGDGDEAIHFLAGDGCYADRSKYPHPALLILDLEIPPRNGEAVIEWIRRQCLLQDLFVVIFSKGMRLRHSPRMLELRANACIFNSHFLKPATKENVQTLLQLFDSWLKRRGERRNSM